MVKHYKKVIEHDIKIDESIVAELVNRAIQKFQEDDVVDTETVFEEIFLNSNEGIEIFVDGNPWFITQTVMYYCEAIYDFIYDIIDDYVTKYVKEGE